MNISEAYNEWSSSYDFVENKTRDAESKVQEALLANIQFDHIIELGCGTGKNTLRLLNLCNTITVADFSEKMIEQAKLKLSDDKVEFLMMDITKEWKFPQKADLISCSLILEHVENIALIFNKALLHLNAKGYLYIGELHPFKQYKGSKARFKNKKGNLIEVGAYIHHTSEYLQAAKENSFELITLKESFDPETKEPRVIGFLFRKK